MSNKIYDEWIFSNVNEFFVDWKNGLTVYHQYICNNVDI